MNETGLQEVMSSLNISQRAYDRLREIHQTWDYNPDTEDAETRLDIE